LGRFGRGPGASSCAANARLQAERLRQIRSSGVSLAALSGGGVVAVWTDTDQDDPGIGATTGVYARLFDEVGRPLGREFRVPPGSAGDQGVARVTALEDGGFAVAWASKGPNALGVEDPYYDAWLRLFEADGRPRTPSIQTTPSEDSDHFGSAVEGLSDGTVLMVTQGSATETNWRIVAGRADGEGRQVGRLRVLEPSADTGVASTAANGSPGVDVASRPDGSFIMTWREESGGNTDRVFARIFDERGRALGPKRAITDPEVGRDKSFASVEALPDGRFAVSWTAEARGERGADAYLRILDRSGAPATPERLVNAGDREGAQVVSDVTHLGKGVTLVTYSSYDAAASSYPIDYFRINGRIFGPDGYAIGKAFRMSGEAYAEAGGADAVVLSSGRLMVSWTEGTSLNQDVWGRIVDLAPSSSGGVRADRLEGLLLNDTIRGRNGDDTLIGDAGNDALRGDGGADRLSGGHGDDRLSGGAGGDRIQGGTGSDRIEGGSGVDRLSGDAGADVFVFTRASGARSGARPAARRPDRRQRLRPARATAARGGRPGRRRRSREPWQRSADPARHPPGRPRGHLSLRVIRPTAQPIDTGPPAAISALAWRPVGAAGGCGVRGPRKGEPVGRGSPAEETPWI
jgi:hypothetical protein